MKSLGAAVLVAILSSVYYFHLPIEKGIGGGDLDGAIVDQTRFKVEPDDDHAILIEVDASQSCEVGEYAAAVMDDGTLVCVRMSGELEGGR